MPASFFAWRTLMKRISRRMNQAYDSGDGAQLPTAKQSVQPLVSVITPTYNRRDSLLATLRALERQTLPADQFEVLVIADGCADGTAGACRALDASYTVRVIEQDNAGPAVARNVGCQQARAPLLVFLDDDVIPHPGFLATHWGIHQQAPRQVAIGPLLLPPDADSARLQPWVRWELATLARQYDDMTRGRWEPSPRQFYTGNASVARAAVLEAGGFNPSFRRAEDVELAYRLLKRGYTFVFAPQARGWHYARRTFASWKAVASAYGRADVMMAQADVWPRALDIIGAEFPQRAMPIRLLARVCISRPLLLHATVTASGAAAYVLGLLQVAAARRLASAAYSVIFNLLFWNGVAEEIGHDAFWELVRRNQPPSAPQARMAATDDTRESVTRRRT
jgi:GT2 family glycosyltransferase